MPGEIHRTCYPRIVVNGVKFLDTNPDDKGLATQLVEEGDIEKAYPAVLRLGRPDGMIPGSEIARILMNEGSEAALKHIFKCQLFVMVHEAMVAAHYAYWSRYWRSLVSLPDPHP